MKVLIYTVYYPAPKSVGILPDTEIVHYFARECVKMGHEVRVVYMNFRFGSKLKSGLHRIFPKEGDYTYEGIPVHYFDVQSVIPKRWYTAKPQADWINRRLCRHFKGLNWKPDRVFVQFPTRFTGIEHPFSFDVPTLAVFHNTDRFYMQRNAAAKQYVSRFDHYGYYNHIIRDVLKKELGKDSVPAYAGIDGELFLPEDQAVKKAEREPSPLRLMYAGKFLKQKNVDTLILAVKELAFPCELEIVGDGEENDALRKLAEGAKNIRFTGRLPRDQVIERMRAADVFAMVSHTETFGLVYLEAMAQGCIVIGSRGEGIDGIIVDGENGFLVQPGSVEEVKQALNTIHAMSRARREALIRAGYALAEDSTNEKMARRELMANQ